MCTCTCKTGALLQHRGAVLSLAAWTYMVQQSLCICVCGQRACCTLFVCMEPIQRVEDHIAAGAICLLCCITVVPAAPQGACWGFAPLLSCCLASFPLLSPFFSLPWQCRLVEKAKQRVSEALQCKQTSSNWTLTGKISAAQCGHHSMCELQGKTARQVKSLKDQKNSVLWQWQCLWEVD